MDRKNSTGIESMARANHSNSHQASNKIVYIWTLVGIAAVAILSQFLSSYIQNVLIRAFLFAIPALTVGVLWGYTGILSFGQGAFFGVGSYGAAMTFTYLGLSTSLALAAFAASLLVAAIIALFVGWLAFWRGATPFYVAVVTLVLAIVMMQLVYSGGSFTGSSSGLVGFSAPSFSMNEWFLIAGAILILISTVLAIFVRSDYGSLLKAIRDNEERCIYLGLNTSRIKITLLAVMAATAAAAGFFYACISVLASPEHIGFVFGTQLVVNTALGGRATVLGPVLGTISLEWVSAYLSGFFPFVWKLLVGVAFVVVIVALPEGLLPPLWRAIYRVYLRLAGKTESQTEFVLKEVSAGVPASALADTDSVLSLKGVTKSYGHLQVLKGIDLEVKRGEIVGVVGPNGAGKTTMMGCISDGLMRTSGDIIINGNKILGHSPAQLVEFGLARSFQKTSVHEGLTVGESLRLARHRQYTPSKITNTTLISLPPAALQVLASSGLEDRLSTPVSDLAHGMKRALELAMVLSLEPSILLLDEPTAGLTKADRELVGNILLELHETLNLTLILIEHDFEFVRQVCSRLVVLHQGRLLLDGEVDDVVNSPIVQEAYSGVQA